MATVITSTNGIPVPILLTHYVTGKQMCCWNHKDQQERLPRLCEEGLTTEGKKSGSILQETNDHDVERQKRCCTHQHIS
jgi:hypothetical protein